jgi:hypothetical protein
MITIKKLLISGTAALTLLLAGCAGGYIGGTYVGPYYGDFGPYYPGPFYGGDFVVGGFHHRNFAGGHHLYGRSFGAEHFGHAHVSQGFRGGRAPASHSHGGGFHR